MKRGLGFALAALFCALLSVNGSAESLKVGVISQSANNWPLFIADEKGFFQRAGLQVEVVVSGDSGRNIDGLATAKFEITHQASDHDPLSAKLRHGCGLDARCQEPGRGREDIRQKGQSVRARCAFKL